MMGLILLVAFLATPPPGDGLEVVGASDCPSADAVLARYAELAPATPAAGRSGPAGQARVSLVGELLEVSLRRGAGTLVGQKLVAAPTRCDDRADVAAALLVAWSAGRGPDVSLSVPYPEVSRPPSAPAPDSSVSLSLPAPAPPASSDWRATLALSFSVVAPLQNDPVAPGVTLEGAFGKTWLEGLASAGVSSERTVSLGPGTASWRAARLRLGAAARLVGRDAGWQLKLAAGGGVASVDAHGNGFATAQDAARVSGEVWGGLRLGLPMWGPLRLVAAAHVAGRLEREYLTAENPVSLHELPRIEVEMTVGASVRFPPPGPGGS